MTARDNICNWPMDRRNVSIIAYLTHALSTCQFLGPSRASRSPPAPSKLASRYFGRRGAPLQEAPSDCHFWTRLRPKAPQNNSPPVVRLPQSLRLLRSERALVRRSHAYSETGETKRAPSISATMWLTGRTSSDWTPSHSNRSSRVRASVRTMLARPQWRTDAGRRTLRCSPETPSSGRI